MSFDISRYTFRPRKNFLGVVMQQGRVQLDSDWNEWQSEYSRRLQAGTLDTIGQAVYPASTPNAFRITPGTNSSGNNALLIGAGRYYVDGLLAENHGPKNQAAWDSALAELSGAPAYSTTSASTDYTQQPYLPGATLPAGNGPFLAYLDVWQRDVTYLEDPDLIDKAVNIDTTGRLQTVWQVKLLDLSNFGSTPDCSTDIPAFDALEQPPAGRLTSGLVPNATSGPCCLAPNTGYTGQENQMYRVEIHQGGATAPLPAGGYTFPLPADTPTFKWSRDNASVETSVSAISTVSTSSGSVSQLIVASLGRDQVLNFGANDWIEITDDVYELNGQPGEIYQIVGNPSANTITLNATVSSHFPFSSGQTIPKLHTRIRRWDQSGKVYQTDTLGNTTLWIDLGAPNSTGLIPVPPSSTLLVLENGVTISFDLSPEPTAANPTSFRVADYWLFAARTSDGSVEIITEAPPFGINHHYAELSVVTFPSTAPDCRVPWPPSQSGCDCCCTANVSPSDLTGNTTLQSILDQHQNLSTPTTICLEAGTYSLPAPLRLTSAHTNITIESCQRGAVRIQALPANVANFNDGLIVLDNSTAITLSGIDFIVPASSYAGKTFAGLPIGNLPASVASLVQNLYVSIGIRVVNGTQVTIENCTFALARRSNGLNDKSAILAAGVFLNGANESLQIQGCEFLPANIDLARMNEAFFTGIAMASSVSFTSASTSIPGAPTNLGGTVNAAGQVSSATALGAGALTKRASAIVEGAPPAATQVAAIGETGVLAGESQAFLNDPGLQNIGGQLQNIFTFGAATPPSLASQGGTVLAASLDQSVISGNTFLRLNAAALLLGETGVLTASQNQVEACRAGLWLITPSLTQSLLLDPQSLALVGTVIAFSLPLPQGDSSSTVAVPAAPSPVFLYTGDNKSGYPDSTGNTWLPDTSVQNVTLGGGSAVYRPIPAPSILFASDPTLYQNERFGNSFSYSFSNLPDGFYSVTLKLAEIFYTDNQTNKGIRIFNVSINGQQVLTDFDIVADAGGALIADDQTFTNIAPNGGQIVIQFNGTTVGSDQNAKVDALELNPLWSGTPFLGSGNQSDSALFFDQLAQVAWQAYAQAGSFTAQFRFENNEMANLSAPGVLLLGDDSVYNEDTGSLILTGNRISGEIQGFNDFAQLTNASFAQGKAAAPESGKFSRYTPGIFSSIVAVIAVSRAVVTSNLITNGNFTDRYGESLILDDSLVQLAAVAVMSNVFGGGILVSPARNLNDSNLDGFVQSWNFLNTIIFD